MSKRCKTSIRLFFDARVFEKATIYTNEYAFKILRPEGNPALLTYNEADLQKYYNTFYYLRRNTETQLKDVTELIESTVKLKQLITKEYSF